MTGFKDVKAMEDRIETIGKASIIQHGKLNDRVYLIKLEKGDCPGIIPSLRALAREHNYAKLFCKVPGWAAPHFLADGYITEAIIPGFFNRKETAFFLAKYLDSDRFMSLEKDGLRDLSGLLGNPFHKEKIPKQRTLKISSLDASDVDQITEVYKMVFQTYPFPIHEPEYILKTMDENVRYFGVKKHRKLIAVSSAEIDMNNRNAEMTDFATNPGYRGLKLGQRLLVRMEKEMKANHISTLYTIARLQSVPMNKVFLKNQYQYAGTLIRNTNISGSIESMNVLYKHI